MEELIRQAFLHIQVIGPHVAEGHYDLVGPNGDIILPQVWETVVEPDWTITMHMWPIPEEPKSPGPQPDARPVIADGPPPFEEGPGVSVTEGSKKSGMFLESIALNAPWRLDISYTLCHGYDSVWCHLYIICCIYESGIANLFISFIRFQKAATKGPRSWVFRDVDDG